MSDFLNYVERNYGCVAEYNRCREEEEERDWSVYETCAENKKKLTEAGDKAMYFCDDCIGCNHYESIGPTTPGFGLGDVDDVEHGICHSTEYCKKRR